MRKIVKSSYNISGQLPSEYLIHCIEEGQIGALDVIKEFIKFCSEDDIDYIIGVLGLDDVYYI